jgi:hypothetical protein
MILESNKAVTRLKNPLFRLQLILAFKASDLYNNFGGLNNEWQELTASSTR